MTQAAKTNDKVAIIGTGNIGRAVAVDLVKGKHPVIIAGRELSSAQALAGELGDLATPLTVADALREADIIVLAIWFNVIKEFLQEHATALAGKIVVDPSNPIALDGKGGFAKIIGEQESAGQLLSQLAPKGVHFVKAFGTLGAGSLAANAHQQPATVLFYATDDSSAQAPIEALIRNSGFEPLLVGGIDQSIRIEVFGDLHEYGALGKPVTLKEAKEKAGTAQVQ